MDSTAVDSLASAETELQTGCPQVALTHAVMSIAYSLLDEGDRETVVELTKKKIERRSIKGRMAARGSSTPVP